VARERELATLAAAYARAAAGEPSMVLVTGDAGIGKTRLVAEFLATIDARVLAGTCAPIGDDGPPYGPLLGALREFDALPGDATQLMETGQLGRARLLEAVLTRLVSESRDRPIVLAIEDMQWSDRSTRDLLDFCVRCLPPARVLLLATVRTDEIERDHPILSFLAELSRHNRVERLDLAGLTPDAAIELVTETTGLPPGSQVVDGIVRRGAGNAFFLEELSAAAGPDRLPGSIREIVHARTAGLSHDASRVLAATAVRNGPVDDALLVELTALTVEQVGTAVGEAIDRRLLLYDGAAETYELPHGLVREAIYAETLPSERRRLHLGFAAYLERTADWVDAGIAAEIAHHCQRAGAHHRGLTASIRAAEAAERVVAYHEAVRHWVRAIEQLAVAEEDVAPTTRRIDLLEHGASAAAQAGDPAQAVELQRLALAEPDARSDRRRTAAGLEALARYLWDAAEDQAGLEVSDEAVAALEALGAEPELAAGLATRARMLMLSSRPHEAIADARRAITLGATPVVEASARITLGAALADVGPTHESVVEIKRGREVAREAGSPDQFARACLNLDYAYWSAGRLTEALEASLDGVAEVRRLGLQWAFGPTLLGNAAEKLFLLGRWPEAHALLDEALIGAGASLAGHDLRNVSADLAIAEGRFSEAALLLEEASDIVKHAGAWNTLLPFWLTTVELAIWRRDWDGGDEAMGLAVERLPDTELLVSLPRLCAIGVRLHAEAALVARATRDHEELEARLAAGRALANRLDALEERVGGAAALEVGPQASAALARAELARLEDRATREQWDDVAEAFAGLGMPHAVAYARLREAEAALGVRSGRSAAREPLREAAVLARSLGAVPLLREIESLAGRARLVLDVESDGTSGARDILPAGLTTRELEVLRLVAEGRTNRQVAAALFITEKTAGLHVSNILAKLGVANRAEAAAVAHRLDLIEGAEPNPAGR
jgi:DNA-binding CsgD family transcriptional regulator